MKGAPISSRANIPPWRIAAAGCAGSKDSCARTVQWMTATRYDGAEDLAVGTFLVSRLQTPGFHSLTKAQTQKRYMGIIPSYKL